MIEFIRRRIKWQLRRCNAEVFADTHSSFAWYEKCYTTDFECGEFVELEYPEWQLYADGIPDETFRSEAGLMCHIIRLTYDLESHILIPSELLYDAGLVYVTNRWVDTWNTAGYIKVERREAMPRRPQDRRICLPLYPVAEKPAALSKPETLSQRHLRVLDEVETREKASQTHWTSPRLVPRHPRRKPYEIERLNRGDDLELDWREEVEVWWGDQCGSGLDEFDTLDDDECYYVLETGECNGEACATITIDEDTPEGQEGNSQVQDAGKADSAEAGSDYEDNYYRFG